MTGAEPIEHFPDAATWEAWLAEHHTEPAGVWLKIAKKGSTAVSVTIGEALDAALCFGWIDGQRKSLDDNFYLQRYQQRRRRSPWSQINVGKAETLIAAGRMRPAGFAQIEAAKADGRWQAAYQPQSDKTLPADLISALEQNPAAQQAYEALGNAERYSVIFQLSTAAAANRSRKLQQLIGKLTAGPPVA